MTKRTASTGILVAIAAYCGMSGTANAVNYSITWMSLAPTLVGNSVPNAQVFNVPGVGNVTMNYVLSSEYSNGRQQPAWMQNVSINSGPDNYAWTNFEDLATIHDGGANQVLVLPWSVTYTFPSNRAGGTTFLAVGGLGSTTSFGGGDSIATVNQNGTFLGDFVAGGFGATQFTGGAGTFSMKNSVTGAGGIDPHWNTEFGIVRIDDSVSSLTVNFSQLRGDGVGVNVGFIVPEPASLSLLAGGTLTLLRRRR
jgi:hypothetical protein